jgi:hypothetical protein
VSATLAVNIPSTPTVRRALRRSLFWVIAVVVIVLIAFAALAVTQSARRGADFGADNPSPNGSAALANVLRQQGVSVTQPASLSSAGKALANGTSTLFLYDPDGYLGSAQLQKLASTAHDVVLLTPGFRQLQALTPTVAQAGTVNKKLLSAGCTLPTATRANTVSGAGNGYRVIANPVLSSPVDAVTCFGSGSKTYSLIELDGRITVLGTTDALTNEHIAERGNAALALNVLGKNAHLVWFQPTIADTTAGGKPTFASLTPPWLTPVMVLLILTTLAAALWRGRRFGPLVVENLPVIVRSSETMHGRARLYQKAGARLRALDALRIGTVDRVGRLCGLPRLATVDEVIAAAAAVTGRSPAEVRQLLFDAVPASDRDLVQYSDALLEIERAVSRSIRPA